MAVDVSRQPMSPSPRQMKANESNRLLLYTNAYQLKGASATQDSLPTSESNDIISY